MADVITVAALILNAVSVCATHCLLGEDHTHWAHRPFAYWRTFWKNKLHFGINYNEHTIIAASPNFHTLPAWCNYFHAFSALRWPLLVIVVYQMPMYWWIVVPAVLQSVWWITKKLFRKEWKSIKNPF